MSLVDVKNIIEEELKKIWPACTCSPIFRYNFRKKSFWSDIVLRISKQQGMSPREVENMLETNLCSRVNLDFSFDNHYLYFTTDSVSSLPLSLNDTRKLTIVLAPRTSKVNSLALLRLYSCCYFQFCLAAKLGLDVELCLGTTDSPISPSNFSKETAESYLKGSGESSEEDFLEYLQSLQDKSERIVLWLSPRSMSHKKFVSLCAKNDPAVDGLWACCPEQNWLQHNEAPSYQEFDVTNLADLCYLASDIRAADLDSAVPKLGEAANLHWFLKSLKKRLASLQLECSETTKERSDLLELKGLPKLKSLFEHNAGLYGDIREYMDYCKYIAQNINLVCNNPVIRKLASDPGLNPQDQELIVGLGDSISALLTPWEELLED